MTSGTNLSGAGLRGQSAGETALCTVGKKGAALTYRGYDMTELAAKATFEEVAFLLVNAKLPNKKELAAYITRLKGLRTLPDTLKMVLESIPKDAHPMDVMRTGCSVLGNLETERDFSQQVSSIERMLALFPSIICYWYRFTHDGVRIETSAVDCDSIAGHFLSLLHDKKPSALHEQVMNTSLILYAEHEFNASTFTARVCASTLSDIHSCVGAAIGSLRGPLHGGANEAAMALIEKMHSVEHAEQEVLAMLARKETIMGFGHAVYRTCDPRNAIIKACAKELSKGQINAQLYPISERIEQVMWREKKLFCNADFFHASAYHFMNIPTKLFTPIFVCSRVSGWSAHVMEQRANNRIIRPNADYIGPASSTWMPIAERK